MFGFLKIKFLFVGVLLASPVIGAWKLRVVDKPDPVAIRQAAFDPKGQSVSTGGAVRVPVEVIEKGGASQWIYIETGNQAVPEPGIFSILMLTGLALALRRTRA